MQVKILAEDQYQIVGVVDARGDCPALDFLQRGDPSTKAMRAGLAQMLIEVAANGLDGVPGAWVHEADKGRKVYEFVKGSLRLFFFKGEGQQIAVCVMGGVKRRQKADPKPVQKAAKWRRDYFDAVSQGTLETIDEN